MARIQIPHPCEAKASDMSPTERGNFCKHCQKEVVDFTCMSDSEIIAFMKAQSGRTCGTFREDQLNRPLIYAAPKRRTALFGGFMSLLAVASPLAGQADPPPIEQHEPVSEPRIEVQFFDVETREPISDVTISLDKAYEAQIHNWGMTKSITFQEGPPTKNIKLTISAPGYETEAIVLPASALHAESPAKVYLRLAPIDISLPHIVKGRVVSDKTGRPLRNVALTVKGTEITTRTDIFGRFSLELTDAELVRHGRLEISTPKFISESLLIREMTAFERVPLYKRDRRAHHYSGDILFMGDF